MRRNACGMATSCGTGSSCWVRPVTSLRCCGCLTAAAPDAAHERSMAAVEPHDRLKESPRCLEYIVDDPASVASSLQRTTYAHDVSVSRSHDGSWACRARRCPSCL